MKLLFSTSNQQCQRWFTSISDRFSLTTEYFWTFMSLIFFFYQYILVLEKLPKSEAFKIRMEGNALL